MQHTATGTCAAARGFDAVQRISMAARSNSLHNCGVHKAIQREEIYSMNGALLMECICTYGVTLVR